MISYALRGFLAGNVGTVAEEMFLYLIYINVVCVSVNLLSFFMRAMYSLLVVLGVQLLCLQLVYLCEQEQLPAGIASGVPVSAVLFCRNMENAGIQVGRWSIYLGLLLLILYGAVCVLLRHMEHAE